MISFDFPLGWMLLGLSPWVWWLHRHSGPTSPLLLPSLEIWQRLRLVAPRRITPVLSTVRGFNGELLLKLLLLFGLAAAASQPVLTLPPPPHNAAIAQVVLSRDAASPSRLDWSVRVSPPPGPRNPPVILELHLPGGGMAARRIVSANQTGEAIWEGGSWDLSKNTAGSCRVLLRDETTGRVLQQQTLPLPQKPAFRAIFAEPKGKWFLERAVMAIPGWELADTLPLFSHQRPIDGELDNAVIFCSPQWAQKHLHSWQGNAWLWGYPDATVNNSALSETSPRSVSASWRNFSHEIFRGISSGKFLPAVENGYLSWRNVLLDSPPWPAQAEILATVAGRAVIAAWKEQTGKRRWLACGWDLESSQLLLSAEFPLFMANGLKWLLDKPAFAEKTQWRVEPDAGRQRTLHLTSSLYGAVLAAAAAARLWSMRLRRGDTAAFSSAAVASFVKRRAPVSHPVNSSTPDL